MVFVCGLSFSDEAVDRSDCRWVRDPIGSPIVYDGENAGFFQGKCPTKLYILYILVISRIRSGCSMSSPSVLFYAC